MSTYTNPAARLTALRADLANLPATAPGWMAADYQAAIDALTRRYPTAAEHGAARVAAIIRPEPEPTPAARRADGLLLGAAHCVTETRQPTPSTSPAAPPGSNFLRTGWPTL